MLRARRGDRAGRAGADVLRRGRAASRRRRSGRIASSFAASRRPAISFAASGSSAATRSPSSCRTCPRRISRSGAAKRRGSPSRSALCSRAPQLAGLLEGGRAEASGDARPDAGDGPLAEGRGRRRRARRPARRARRRHGALRAPPEQAPALRALAKSETAAFKVPVLDFRAELEKERGDALNFEPPKPDDISSYFCTGGTTGAPKIARRTHFSEAFDAWAMTSFKEDLFGAGKTILCGLPLFHVNGQLVTGLAPWSKGAHVVMATPQGYRGEGVIANFWALVEHFRVSLFSGVPTVYSALLQTPIAGRDIRSLEAAICGAAPMPAQLFHDFQRATGVRILEGYGLTEGACASSLDPVRRPAADRLDRPALSLSGHARADPRRRRRYRPRRGDRRDRRHRDPRPQRLRGLPRPRPQQGDLDRAAAARAGSTPATSAGRTPTATSGSPGARRSSSSAAATTSIRS